MLALTILAFGLLAPTQREITVVRPDGSPATGAQVRWFEGEPPANDLGALDDAAIASGNLLVADERGNVMLPGERTMNVVASAPGSWTCRLRLPPDGSARLQLQPDSEVLVETVDAKGVPVGDVPVLLWFEESDAASSWSAHQALRTNSSTGRVVFRHASVRLPVRLDPSTGFAWDWELAQSSRAIAGESGWFVQVLCNPVPSGARAPCPNPPDAEPVRLSVEGLAAVDVVVRDSNGPVDWKDGELVSDPFRCNEARISFGEFSVCSLESWENLLRFFPMGVREPLREGRAKVWMALGGAARFALVRRNALSDGFVATLSSPALGETHALARTVDVDVRLRTRYFRPLVDGDRIPNATFEVRRECSDFDSSALARSDSSASVDDRDREWPEELSGSEFSAPHRLVTDADGVFAIDSARQLLPGLAVKLEREGKPPLFAGVADRFGAPGQPVLFQLRAAPAPVRGTVVDDTGAPIEGARVSLVGVPYVPMELTADALGAFECPTPSLWQVRGTANMPGHRQATLEQRVDDEPIVAVLCRNAGARGVLRVTDPHGPVDLNVLLLRREAGVPLESSPGRSIGCSCDGLFEFPDLEPGRYTLIVRRARSGKKPLELATVESFEVNAGEVSDLGEIRVE